jgi:hypothetical protein
VWTHACRFSARAAVCGRGFVASAAAAQWCPRCWSVEKSNTIVAELVELRSESGLDLLGIRYGELVVQGKDPVAQIVSASDSVNALSSEVSRSRRAMEFSGVRRTRGGLTGLRRPLSDPAAGGDETDAATAALDAWTDPSSPATTC